MERAKLRVQAEAQGPTLSPVQRALNSPDYGDFYRDVLGIQTLYPKQLELIKAVHEHRRISVCGCNSCIAPETRITNALTGEQVSVIDIYHDYRTSQFPVWSLHKGQVVRAWAYPPFLKGVTDLYEVILDGGQRFVSTLDHRLRTPQGWVRLRDLYVGALLACDALPYQDAPMMPKRSHASSSMSLDCVYDQSTHGACGDRCSRTAPGYHLGYQHSRRSSDGLPLTVSGIGLDASPSLVDALARTLSGWRMDDPALESARSRLGLLFGPHSREGSCRREPRDLGGREDLDDVLRNCLLDLDPSQVPSLSTGETYFDAAQRTARIEHLSPEHLDVALHSCCSAYASSFSPITPHKSYTYHRIQAIQYVRNGPFYDLRVPITNNYLAEGVFHHNSGKDYTTGRIVLDWLNRYSPSKVVVVGPSDRQVKAVVFQETRSAFYSTLYPLVGSMPPAASYVGIGPQHFAIGLTAPQGSPMNLQGFHSPHLLVIITEAHSMQQDHIDTVKRLNPTCIVMTGNPFTSSGEFFDSHHTRRDQWYTINISAFDTPNIVEGRDIIPGLVNWSDIDSHLEDWGEDNPLYKATVLGEFPDDLSLGIVPLNKALSAVNRIDPDAHQPGTKAIVAADIGGDSDDSDKTVVYRRDGYKLALLAKLQGKDTQTVAGWLLSYCRDHFNWEGRVAPRYSSYPPEPFATLVVDANGLGAGVADRVREEEPNLPLVRFNAGSNAQRPDLYSNRGTETWIRLRSAFQSDSLSIPNDQALISQVVGRKFIIMGTGKMALQSKKDYKGKASNSPDEADAAAMTFATSDTPQSTQEVAQGMKHESAWKVGATSVAPPQSQSRWKIGGYSS